MASIERSGFARKLAAVAMVTVLAVAVALACVQFAGGFRSTSTVTLVADRAGLVMNPDAKVRLRGVTIGRVGAITATSKGQVALRLDMNTTELSHVPANVRANIASNTVFGAKSVDLVSPPDPSTARLSAGAHISADHVQVELNTLFANLVTVLAQVQPEKLNATIGAVDSALSGRGSQIGDGLDNLARVVGKVNTVLPQLNRDITATSQVSGLYADVMGDIARILGNATVTGNTLANRATDLDALLVNTTGMADTLSGVIGPRVNRISTALSNLNPVTRLLGYQSPGLRCFIVGVDRLRTHAMSVFGPDTGYLSLDAAVTPGKEPYRYPENLPVNEVDGPPTCAGVLTDEASNTHLPFYVGKNASLPYQPRTSAKVDPAKIFKLMFGPEPRG